MKHTAKENVGTSSTNTIQRYIRGKFDLATLSSSLGLGGQRKTSKHTCVYMHT